MVLLVKSIEDLCIGEQPVDSLARVQPRGRRRDDSLQCAGRYVDYVGTARSRTAT
jgi:hypothetical protein